MDENLYLFIKMRTKKNNIIIVQTIKSYNNLLSISMHKIMYGVYKVYKVLNR